jgi:hypothetical protein
MPPPAEAELDPDRQCPGHEQYNGQRAPAAQPAMAIDQIVVDDPRTPAVATLLWDTSFHRRLRPFGCGWSVYPAGAALKPVLIPITIGVYLIPIG